MGMRLMVYDRTAKGLSNAWAAGSILYRALGRLDRTFGATNWSEALDFIAKHDDVEEVQFWGHGKWGSVLVGEENLDSRALEKGHALFPKIEAVKDKLSKDALVWLRTCEAFGANAGHDFAMKLSDTLGARVAGHTFIIGGLQSGLHGLAPGQKPDWSADEGLAEGTAAKPVRAHGSSARAVNTITCFEGRIPSEWFVPR